MWQHTTPGEDAADEAAIIARAQLDPAAFAPLYDRYAPRVFQYLLSRSTSADAAAELLQIVFLRAVENLPSFRHRHPRSFAAWLFRIAHNAAADSHRRGAPPSIPWDYVPEGVVAFPGPGPENVVLRRETVEILRLALDDLSPDRRELIALRFAARLSIAEIAATVGRSEAAVRKQLLRTIATLQERFDEYGL